MELVFEGNGPCRLNAAFPSTRMDCQLGFPSGLQAAITPPLRVAPGLAKLKDRLASGGIERFLTPQGFDKGTGLLR